MGQTYESGATGQGRHIGVVVSRFNAFVTEKLLDGARKALGYYGVAEEDVDVVWVPGAFEIPLAAQRLAYSGRYSAVICLGAVIRGETPHFDYVAAEASRGIAEVSRDSGVPTIFGVLTTDTVEQALARAVEGKDNRGYTAAQAALEMANLLDELPQ